ncbi:hypothetical protein BwSF12_33060 [Bradyrhizobium ottawaense]|nr:hypothetical protein TM102_26170 [Bradyrhizobium sp. TM102]GMO33665.1 hypothetical protein BwSF12_33060 [Bradyrhizobium ottawaense]GMO90721.1 hypothetical protein BwSF19_65230 [Bradyrhizobium ottawaense]
MQDGRSCSTIKEHCNASGAKADFDDRADLVSQMWASKRPKLTHLETGAHDKPIGHMNNPNFNIHYA